MLRFSMPSPSVISPPLPPFLYGTAWKEERTEELTALALEMGFRGVDTANQRKHYHEAAVGRALQQAWASGLKRDELFVQTKYTFRGGQDHRLPYDPAAAVDEQVRQSFALSLEHLGCGYLDSLLLHGPERQGGLSRNDWLAWEAITQLQEEGRTRAVGVSNVSYQQLKALCERAAVMPQIVQNRCYQSDGWDHDVRRYCAQKGIRYQGFSLLTANRRFVAGPAVAAVKKRLGCSSQEVVFCLALRLGMCALTGTSSAEHMRQDLACRADRLSSDDVARLLKEVP